MIPGAIKDLFHSEKGLWAFLLPMVGATVMLGTGSVSAQQWLDFAKIMSGIYVSGKTIQGGAKVFAESRQIGPAAQKKLSELEDRVRANDAVVDRAIAELKGKKRYAGSKEG